MVMMSSKAAAAFTPYIFSPVNKIYATIAMAITGIPGKKIWKYAPMAAAIAGGANTNIQFNDGGTAFGGTANLTFDKTSNKVTLQGHQVFGNIGAAPANVANSVAVYNNAVGSGGTGLYVQSTSVSDELVSKSKAIVFAIIF